MFLYIRILFIRTYLYFKILITQILIAINVKEKKGDILDKSFYISIFYLQYIMIIDSLLFSNPNSLTRCLTI